MDLPAKQVAIWDAINTYTAACGGDTGAKTGGAPRMAAVAGIERIMDGYPLTFSEARGIHLQVFDIHVANLRAIIADKDWHNMEYKAFLEIWAKIHGVMKDICALNNAETAANRLCE